MKLFQNYNLCGKYFKLLLCIIPIFFIFLFIPKAEASELSTGFYTISPSNNLTVRLNTDTAKSNAVLKGSNNLSGQKFYLQKLSDGYYKIGTGVTGSASVLESDLSQKRWSKANSQKWTITSSGDYFTIKNKATGKFLCFSGKTLNASTTTSLWKFTPYSDKITVTFKDSANATLKRESVDKGGEATEPIVPTIKDKIFIGWSKNYKGIKENITTVAQYVTPTASIDKTNVKSYLEAEKDIYKFFPDNGISVQYPRIRKVGDYYILIWHGSNNGSINGGYIYYSTSKDLQNWSNPTTIWKPTYYQLNGKEDVRIFTNADIQIMPNNKLFVYCAYRSQNYARYNTEMNGITAKEGVLKNGKIVWSEDEKDEKMKNEKGNIINVGRKLFESDCLPWEPSMVKKTDNTYIMSFSIGMPWSTISSMSHTPSCTAVTVTRNQGKTWSTPKISATKFTGKYTTGTKEINYYTAQMPQGTVLKDGRFFYVYEMWAPNNKYGIPEGYSVSSAIFSKNYNFTYSRKITTQDIWENSKQTDTITNDPRAAKDYSGDIQKFKTVSNGVGCAPYVKQFPTGEVIVSYNDSGNFYCSLLTKNENKTIKVFSGGYWGSIELNNSNQLIAVLSCNKSTGIQIRRINLR